MKRQNNRLTLLGCSSSAAIMLALGNAAVAAPVEYSELESPSNTLSQSDSNPISDALGCGCATCQLSQIQSY